MNVSSLQVQSLQTLYHNKIENEKSEKLPSIWWYFAVSEWNCCQKIGIHGQSLVYLNPRKSYQKLDLASSLVTP